MMSNLRAYGEQITNVFQLIGNKENDTTKSIAWALNKCPGFLKNVINEIFSLDINPDDVSILYQNYDAENGITDLEITDLSNFHLIIEAKRGWQLPGVEQLTKYSKRYDFNEAKVAYKAIVSMSECSEEYAKSYLINEINGIPIKHLSWSTIKKLAILSRSESNHEQKLLLDELDDYLGGIMTMQNKNSNWVYIVALGTGKPENCNITWIDIVKNYNKYFHPQGGDGWPKEPPNYIAFRYGGKLQAIHHIENYTVTKNIHDEIKEMPNKDKERNYFVYNLGPAIIPSKEIKTGKIYANGRVWAMIDTLLTSDTISEARDISKSRNTRTGIFSELTNYIPLLEHDSYGEWKKKSENTVPFVDYTPVVNNFIKSLLKFTEEHPEYEGKHYYDVLSKHGLWQTCPLEQIDVSNLDAKCVFSIMICMLREEHFGCGDILEYLQNGAVIKWLNRLKELDY